MCCKPNEYHLLLVLVFENFFENSFSEGISILRHKISFIPSHHSSDKILWTWVCVETSPRSSRLTFFFSHVFVHFRISKSYQIKPIFISISPCISLSQVKPQRNIRCTSQTQWSTATENPQYMSCHKLFMRRVKSSQSTWVSVECTETTASTQASIRIP